MISTAVACCAVIVSLLSVGAFGRIEIRFSCYASQLTVLRNRSWLPWMRIA